jgi:AcrR family transcriptional regulator
MQETTKEKILRESLRLFGDKGYDSTTMKDIAVAVEIKAASLYAHFHGKAEIFKAVFESALSTWVGMINGIFDHAGACEGLEEGLDLILCDFVRAMMGSVAYRFWARVYVFPPNPVGGDELGRIVEMDRSFTERLKAYCVARLPASVAPRDAETLACSLSYFAMGIMMYAELRGGDALMGEIRRGVAFHMKAIATGERSVP